MKESFVILIFVLGLFCSCSTTKKTTNIESDKTESHRETADTSQVSISGKSNISERKDSVWVHDSVFTYLKGDTTYLYKEREVIKYSVLHDTLFLWKVDTMHVYLAKNDSSVNNHNEIKTEIKKPPNVIDIIIRLMMIFAIIVTIIIGVLFIIKKSKLTE